MSQYWMTDDDDEWLESINQLWVTKDNSLCSWQNIVKFKCFKVFKAAIVDMWILWCWVASYKHNITLSDFY